jgi:hypothetical protein
MFCLQKVIKSKYHQYHLKYEIWQFNRYRKLYDTFSFDHKKRTANKWLKQFPEQAHFNYTPIKHWLDTIVPKPVSVIEIGGWRGDLAELALSSFENIELWHNYDLISLNGHQKCNDSRYKLISLEDDLWHLSLSSDYNALIATHVIEHLKWAELIELIKWIPPGIRTVLLEAPLPASDEDINWKGDHSSHILEKGWEQVILLMERHMFSVDYRDGNTYIFKRSDSNV